MKTTKLAIHYLNNGMGNARTILGLFIKLFFATYEPINQLEYE